MGSSMELWLTCLQLTEPVRGRRRPATADPPLSNHSSFFLTAYYVLQYVVCRVRTVFLSFPPSFLVSSLSSKWLSPPSLTEFKGGGQADSEAGQTDGLEGKWREGLRGRREDAMLGTDGYFGRAFSCYLAPEYITRHLGVTISFVIMQTKENLRRCGTLFVGKPWHNCPILRIWQEMKPCIPLQEKDTFVRLCILSQCCEIFSGSCLWGPVLQLC